MNKLIRFLALMLTVLLLGLALTACEEAPKDSVNLPWRSLTWAVGAPLPEPRDFLQPLPDGYTVRFAEEYTFENYGDHTVTLVATAPDGTETEGGFGLAGTLPEPMTLAELCRRIRAFLPLDRMCGVARLIGDPASVVRRVAFCTGSGSSLLEDAAAAGAELYITGDMKYHDALALYSRQNGNSSNFCPMAILDAGHFSLEEEMMRRFALQLEKELDGVTVTFLPGRDPFQPLTFLSEVPEVLS